MVDGAMIDDWVGGIDAMFPVVDRPELDSQPIKDKLDAFDKKYKSVSLQICNEVHQDILKRFSRARKEFDSTRFFVLVVGPVKSGKSTFVNVLARNIVSPIDVTECTAIPTIIGKSGVSEGHYNKIVSYIPVDDEIDIGEVFDDIIDVLRGIAKPSVFDGRIEKSVTECNEEKLKSVVTVSSSERQKSLLATIGIEETPFINDEIMVIDMPGLDGGVINWNNNPLYVRMVKRADFIFFIQSSTTSINESSVSFLNWLLANRDTNVPLRLIHNEHDSLYFLKEDIRKARVEKQVEVAKRFILSNIPNPHDLDFNNYVLNLAKVGKSLMAPQEICKEFVEELKIDRDKYAKKENEIVDELRTKRLQYKERNCINRSLHCIEQANTEYGDILRKVCNRMLAIENVVSGYERIKKNIENKNASFAQLKEDFENKINSESIEFKYKEEIEQKTKLYIGENVNEKCSGKKLEEHIDKLVEEFNKITLLEENNSVYKFLKEELPKVIGVNIDDSLRKICDLLQTSKEDFDFSDIAVFQQSIIFKPNYGGIERRKWFGLMRNIYTVEECREKIQTFKTYVIDEYFPTFFKEYRKNVVNSFDEIFKKWKEGVCSKLDKQFQEKKVKFDEERRHLNNQKTQIEEIIRYLN